MSRPLLIALSVLAAGTTAADPRLIDREILQHLAAEVSGESAKRNLDRISLYHRTRASSQFRQAAEHVRDQLQAYGFEQARILEYPADGKTMFGTQKSRPAWDVESAELWEVDAEGTRLRRLAHWESMPLTLAQDSLSGAVTTTLVDIGEGTAEAHYEGLDVRGRLVLTESQPSAVVDLAVGRFGAAGIVSYAPNQKSAWWKEDGRLVRWGHIGSFPKAGSESFGFMISLDEARALRQRLAKGETVWLAARVDAGHHDGAYSLVEAVIPGSDPAVGDEQIVYTCHLDHPRPGANDNASGCVAILEAARSLQRLIGLEIIPRPRRSLRFVWPAEIEGTLIYLVSEAELAARIKANIHLDMVGGDPAVTKAVFRISGGPYSLPHFIGDVGHAIGRFVNAETLTHTNGGSAAFPLVSREGGREPLLAVMEGISLGSDHQVFNEGSWRIPGIYLHDWPDRYIHTNFDTPGNIDPTKLKRSAFIAAAAGWYLADLGADDGEALLELLREGALRRATALLEARSTATKPEAIAMTRVHWEREREILASVEGFLALEADSKGQARSFLDQLERTTGPAPPAPDRPAALQRVFLRNAAIQGPMSAFGYAYLEDHLDAGRRAALTLDSARAYEALNLVDGERSVGEITDWLVAEFGTTDGQAVLDYLEALALIDVLRPAAD